MKCLVYGIYFLETVQSVLTIEAGFRTFVNGLGDLEVLNQVKTSWLTIPLLTAIGELSAWVCPADVLISHPVTFFVQVFYAYRISILARSKKVAGAIIAVGRKSCIPFKP